MTEYSISRAEFEVPAPTNPQKTCDLEEIFKRVNFAAGLTTVYALSEGRENVLAWVFTWKRLHDGFEYKTILSNFLSAGGVEVWSDQERELFLTKYKNVQRHPFVSSNQFLESFVFGSLEKQMGKLAKGELKIDPKFNNLLEVLKKSDLLMLIKKPGPMMPTSQYELNYLIQ